MCRKIYLAIFVFFTANAQSFAVKSNRFLPYMRNSNQETI